MTAASKNRSRETAYGQYGASFVSLLRSSPGAGNFYGAGCAWGRRLFPMPIQFSSYKSCELHKSLYTSEKTDLPTVRAEDSILLCNIKAIESLAKIYSSVIKCNGNLIYTNLLSFHLTTNPICSL